MTGGRAAAGWQAEAAAGGSNGKRGRLQAEAAGGCGCRWGRPAPHTWECCHSPTAQCWPRLAGSFAQQDQREARHARVFSAANGTPKHGVGRTRHRTAVSDGQERLTMVRIQNVKLHPAGGGGWTHLLERPLFPVRQLHQSPHPINMPAGARWCALRMVEWPFQLSGLVSLLSFPRE